MFVNFSKLLGLVVWAMGFLFDVADLIHFLDSVISSSNGIGI